jgi:predicted ArsR family transcriptional regulator
MDFANVDRQLASLAGLCDPLRRALYRHVAERGVPVSRDEAARGPGAGRPAKHYVRADRQIELSLPARDYAALAELLADAIEASGTAQAALNRAASTLGAELAAEAANRTAPEGDPDQVLAALRQVLASRGYEPYQDADGIIRLRNCPFDRIAAGHRQLVCGANQAMLQALADHQSDDRRVRAVLDPQPGRCCVALTSTS